MSQRKRFGMQHATLHRYRVRLRLTDRIYIIIQRTNEA
jgi:hypothetical protein